MDNLTRVLLTKYDPTNEALREPVGDVNTQGMQAYSQSNKASQNELQSVVYKSSTGVTTTMAVIMSRDDYTDDEITLGCMAFNMLNPTSMSKSYQLPVAFEGIPVGSWVYVTTRKG